MKIRIKMRDMPGDIPRGEKIQMLERPHAELRPAFSFRSHTVPYRTQVRRAKSYKRIILMRERAVFKERTQREIARGLAECHD